VVSPLLATVPAYVLDLWIEAWRGECRGDVIVADADDLVVGFENR